MESALEQLRTHIRERLGKAEPENLELVISKFSYEILRKGEHLLKEGDICKKVYFVCQGDIQISYSNENGQVWTRDFISTNQWACSLDSFLNQIPAQEEMKCLNEVRVLCIDYTHFGLLMKVLPDFATVYQRILTELHLKTLNTIQTILSNTAENRIRWLYTHKSSYAQKYPAKLLASYLHLNKDVFSRLRPKLQELH